MENRTQWTAAEKKVARAAYDRAYRRECDAIIAEIRTRAAAMTEPVDIWALHDYLSSRRRDVDEKYNYRYSRLMGVFRVLYYEGWLKEADLAGLAPEKVERIKG